MDCEEGPLAVVPVHCERKYCCVPWEKVGLRANTYFRQPSSDELMLCRAALSYIDAAKVRGIRATLSSSVRLRLRPLYGVCPLKIPHSDSNRFRMFPNRRRRLSPVTHAFLLHAVAQAGETWNGFRTIRLSIDSTHLNVVRWPRVSLIRYTASIWNHGRQPGTVSPLATPLT
jgi:hypothetical protein